MRLFELIERVASTALLTQSRRGAFPAGHNGPYRDAETAVRNTAHWLITLSTLHDVTGEIHWRKAAERAGEYLRSEEARPHGFTFHHRNRDDKDRCNGLIGQAWTLEALATADASWGDGTLTTLGERVFFLHEFHHDSGLWRSREIDGGDGGIDSTFNHQLWFAAGASLLQGTRRAEVMARVNRFLDRCPRNMTVLDSGLIYHPLRGRARTGPLLRRLALALKDGAERTPWLRSIPRVSAARAQMVRKSIGYHSFNLYAFALLERQQPDHPFFGTATFDRILRYVESEIYLAGLDDNEYGFPYNPPGWEVPVALSLFGRWPEDRLARCAGAWVRRQTERTFNARTLRFDRNNPDPETLTARLYEGTRLPRTLWNDVELTDG